jgi:hypothetical protein
LYWCLPSLHYRTGFETRSPLAEFSGNRFQAAATHEACDRPNVNWQYQFERQLRRINPQDKAPTGRPRCCYAILLSLRYSVTGGQIHFKPVARDIAAETGNEVEQIDFATDIG